jgi:hypothetical protein
LVRGVKRRAWDGWIYKEEESPCVLFFGEVTLKLGYHSFIADPV